MKNTIITKINIFGKITKYVVNILKILLLIILLSTVCIGCSVIQLPENIINLTASHGLDIEIHLSETYSDHQDSIVSNLNKSDIRIDNIAYKLLSIEKNNTYIHGTAISEDHNINLQKAGIVLLISSLYPIALLFLLHYIGLLCDYLKNNDTPFSKDTIDILWKIALLLTLTISLFEVIEVLSEWLIWGNITISINTFAILGIAALFILIIRVFRYGIILQQESDETL